MGRRRDSEGKTTAITAKGPRFKYSVWKIF